MHSASIPSSSRLLALAHRVRLIGPMTESAFAAQPWLVERNGRFLQVTEVLYRVAELADGTRTIDQIAADLSKLTGSNVPVDLVWRMMESRLVPIGLIAAD